MKTKIACVQMQSALGCKEENLKKMEEKVKAVMEDADVQLILFPELAVTGYECGEQYKSLAEPFPEGKSIRAMSEIAKKHHVYLASVWILFLYFSGIIGDYYNLFLAVVGFIGGPSIMIVLVDYFLVRKRQFSMRDMFDQTAKSKYYYTKGFNLVGAAAFICGTIAYFAVYDPINGVGRNVLFNLLTGTGSSCIAAAVVYYGLSKVPSIRKYLLNR